MKKYTYRRQLKRIRDDGSARWEEWSEELFNTKDEIEKLIQTEIEYEKNNYNHMFSITTDYEIKEVELTKMTIEGNVSDYGEYEDYTVLVGDARIERVIIDKFKGQKIRINIEVIE